MVSNENKIVAYLHCDLCFQELQELKLKQSPQEYQRIQAGWTKEGLQIWCTRHDCNVIHIDFEGHQHEANTTIAMEE